MLEEETPRVGGGGGGGRDFKVKRFSSFLRKYEIRPQNK